MSEKIHEMSTMFDQLTHGIQELAKTRPRPVFRTRLAATRICDSFIWLKVHRIIYMRGLTFFFFFKVSLLVLRVSTSGESVATFNFDQMKFIERNLLGY